MPTNEQYRDWARENLSDDELSIDEGARVSMSGDGAWVQAWVWVNREEIEED